jgi:hypothetical protein
MKRQHDGKAETNEGGKRLTKQTMSVVYKGHKTTLSRHLAPISTLLNVVPRPCGKSRPLHRSISPQYKVSRVEASGLSALRFVSRMQCRDEDRSMKSFRVLTTRHWHFHRLEICEDVDSTSRLQCGCFIAEQVLDAALRLKLFSRR